MTEHDLAAYLAAASEALQPFTRDVAGKAQFLANGILDLTKLVGELREEIADQERTFALMRSATERAVTHWRAADPATRSDVLYPDYTKLIEWLLAENGRKP